MSYLQLVRRETVSFSKSLIVKKQFPLEGFAMEWRHLTSAHLSALGAHCHAATHSFKEGKDYIL